MGEKISLCRLNFAKENKERLEDTHWEDRMARNWVRRDKKKQDKLQDKCKSCTEEQKSEWLS